MAILVSLHADASSSNSANACKASLLINQNDLAKVRAAAAEASGNNQAVIGHDRPVYKLNQNILGITLFRGKVLYLVSSEFVEFNFVSKKPVRRRNFVIVEKQTDGQLQATQIKRFGNLLDENGSISSSVHSPLVWPLTRLSLKLLDSTQDLAQFSNPVLTEFIEFEIPGLNQRLAVVEVRQEGQQGKDLAELEQHPQWVVVELGEYSEQAPYLLTINVEQALQSRANIYSAPFKNEYPIPKPQNLENLVYDATIPERQNLEKALEAFHLDEGLRYENFESRLLGKISAQTVPFDIYYMAAIIDSSIPLPSAPESSRFLHFLILVDQRDGKMTVSPSVHFSPFSEQSHFNGSDSYNSTLRHLVSSKLSINGVKPFDIQANTAAKSIFYSNEAFIGDKIKSDTIYEGLNIVSGIFGIEDNPLLQAAPKVPLIMIFNNDKFYEGYTFDQGQNPKSIKK